MNDRSNNVEVLTIVPGFVDTSMVGFLNKRKGLGICTPKQCVEACLRDMSYEPETFGTKTHEI